LAGGPVPGVADRRANSVPHARPLIARFLGGFLLGPGIERYGLHRRIALHILLWVGTRPPMARAGLGLNIIATLVVTTVIGLGGRLIQV